MFFNENNPLNSESTDNSIPIGIKNFQLFQNHPFFKWPLWINVSLNPQSKYFRQITKPLINNVIADALPFTNFLSSEKLISDISGMLSVSYADWSFEIWHLEDGKLFRPQENIDSVKINRSHLKNITSIVSKSGKVHLTETIYGARTEIDEAVIEVECTGGSSDSYIIVALRPYNAVKLGTINKAEFIKDDLFIKINGARHAAVDQNPDYVLSENSDSSFDFSMKNLSSKSTCSSGLASVALAYKIHKTGRKIHLRIGLDDKNHINGFNANYKDVKDEFVSYSGTVLSNGFKLSISDKEFEKWFYFLKISCLNIRKNGLMNSYSGDTDYKKSFWAIHGFNRMGYFRESISIADTQMKNLHINPKKINNSDIVNSCYIIMSISDIFIKSRDSEYLQSVFTAVKEKTDLVLGFSLKIKKLSDFKDKESNRISVHNRFYEIMLMCRTFKQAAYLARCMGIFGDENKYEKEFSRLEALIRSNLEKYNSTSFIPGEEFFISDIFSIYPFRILSSADPVSFKIIDKIKNIFGAYPFFIKSIGVDVFSSAAAANAMLMLKHPDAVESVKAIMESGKAAYSLSSCVNPQNGAALYSDNSSSMTAALFFSAVRNSLFIDYPESLDIFPVPDPEWFVPGFEINIENAPSRFGILSIRIISTSSEVQIQFDKLPKFMPPQLVINLPFKAKIVPGEDFILKKEHGGSFFLNGWPSIVRFIKK